MIKFKDVLLSQSLIKRKCNVLDRKLNKYKFFKK